MEDNNPFYKFFDYLLTNIFNSLFANGPLSALPEWLQVVIAILILLIIFVILFCTFLYFAGGLYKQHSFKNLIEEIKSRYRENTENSMYNPMWRIEALFGAVILWGFIHFFIHNKWQFVCLSFIFPGIVFLPPAYRYLQRSFEINIPFYLKFIIFILAGIMGVAIYVHFS